MMQTKELTELRGKLRGQRSAQTNCSNRNMSAVSDAEIKPFIEGIKPIYSGITMNNSGNTVTIQSKDTAQFSQFREAIGHVANGGLGWKVRVEGFCVGRECKSNPLDAVLKVEKLNIDKPIPKTE